MLNDDLGAGVLTDLDDERRIAAARRLVPVYPGNPTLDSLSALAARLLGTRSAQVSLLTDVQHIAAGVGLRPGALERATPRRDSLCMVTASQARPLRVPDARHDERVLALPPVASGAVGSYIGVPLRDKDDRVVGAFCAYDAGTRPWSDRDVAVLEELGGAVTAELERTALAAEHEALSVRLDLAMDAAGVGSWDWDLLTGELTWDDRLLRMFGFEPGEFDRTIETFNRRLHPEDLPRVTRALEAAIERDVPYAETYRVVLPDRSIRWISARGDNLHDEEGRTVRIIGAGFDITEQYLAELESSTTLSLLSLVERAGTALSDSLEVEHAVQSLARMVVPDLADWSMISLVDRQSGVQDVESWHRDPDKREATRIFAEHRFAGRTEAVGSLHTLRSGDPFLLESGAKAFSRRTLRDPQALEALEQLDIESVAVLPLLVEGVVIGLMTLARGLDRPAISEAELATAMEISRRASTHLHHARSFSRIRDISEQLQRSMLSEPVHPEGMDIAVLYSPAAEAAQVGGDWYDAFVQPDGSTMLVIGDVIGHDSAAAAAMGQLRSLTRGIAFSMGLGPAEVLTRVSRAMEGLEMDTVATALVAQVSPADDAGRVRLRWSNAGHPPALVRSPDGETQLLENHDLLLGLVADEPRSEHETVLEPGSLVLLFTDGLVERRGENISVGLERLREVIRSSGALPVQELVTDLQHRMAQDQPDDDIAVVALRVTERDRD